MRVSAASACSATEDRLADAQGAREEVSSFSETSLRDTQCGEVVEGLGQIGVPRGHTFKERLGLLVASIRFRVGAPFGGEEGRPVQERREKGVVRSELTSGAFQGRSEERRGLLEPAFQAQDVGLIEVARGESRRVGLRIPLAQGHAFAERGLGLVVSSLVLVDARQVVEELGEQLLVGRWSVAHEGDRAFSCGFGLVVAPLHAPQLQGEVQGAGEPHGIVAFVLQEDGHGPILQYAGVGVAAFLVEDGRELARRRGDPRVFRPEGTFKDPERPSLILLGEVPSALVVVRGGKKARGLADAGIVGRQDLLPQLQGASSQREDLGLSFRRPPRFRRVGLRKAVQAGGEGEGVLRVGLLGRANRGAQRFLGGIRAAVLYGVGQMAFLARGLRFRARSQSAGGHGEAHAQDERAGCP